jgi:hypothetical protein
MVENDLGGRPKAESRKNAKIPEVVKVNNYQYFFTSQYAVEFARK